MDLKEKNGRVHPKHISNIEIEEPRKIPYPKRVFFIIGNEFCERFNYTGFKSILVLYLHSKLGYSENDATVFYHILSMAVYAFCLVGGIIADVWWGKFKTILYLSFVYAIGSTIISISSIPIIGLPSEFLLLIGMVCVAFGSGGIKPCVGTFGGDQFKLPEQSAQSAAYFSLYFIALSAGSFLSTIITPILREDVHCFGDNDCFPLAFGVPAVLMCFAIVLFLAGRSSYTHIPTSSDNMLVNFSKCITNAVSTRIREGKTNPRPNILDYSIDKFGEEFVNDTKVLLRLLVLNLSLPVFWALCEQQGSSWTFQATKMDGDIGFYTIKPDQLQMMGPFLFLIFVPIFDSLIYPLLFKIGIRRPLQKLTIGFILTAVSFFLTALVQFKIDSSPEKSVSMLWTVPQNIVMVFSELIVVITGLAFIYEQAPQRMKTVVMSFWLLTDAVGNLILICIAEIQFFESQAHEFLLFSALMMVDSMIFMVLAYYYTSNSPTEVIFKTSEKSEVQKFTIEKNVSPVV